MKLKKKIATKIVPRDLLKEKLRELKESGKSIVFTNGCFDLLHPGHIHVLTAASEEGDVLVAGLNSDASVRRLKGHGRPVMEEHARALVLASLAMVDYVVIFGEDTPLELIRLILPDTLVKGGDYTVPEVVGADIVQANGGRTVIVPLLEGFSSSKFIEKTKK